MPIPDDRRCTATSKRSGNRCRRAAINGGTVCHMHGGAAPQVKAAAARRLYDLEVAETVDAMVAKYDIEARSLDHHQVLRECCARAWLWVQVTGGLVGQLAPKVDGLEASPDTRGIAGPNHLGDGAPHVLVTMHEEAKRDAAKMSKMAIDAGIDERLLELEEDKAEALVASIKAILTDLGVADHPDAPAVVRQHLMLLAGGAVA